MDKIDVVLVILNKDFPESAIKNLNFDNANLLAIVMDDTEEKIFQLGDKEIPLRPFQTIKGLMRGYKAFFFLLSGYEKNISDVTKIKNFLMATGSPAGNIINFELSSQLSETWLANLKHVEERGADFFVTGNEYTRNGLNLDYIPGVKGAILADKHQDLRQSFLTAKHVFEHVAPSTIKFVLIGLAPYAFHYDNGKDFANCVKNFQYMLALDLPEESRNDLLLKNLVSNEIINNFLATTADQADLNFDAVKETLERQLSAAEIINWEDDLQTLPITQAEKDANALRRYIELCLKNAAKFSVNGAVNWEEDEESVNAVVKRNVQILKDYIELCLSNGAKPIGVVFPFSEAVRKNYDKEILTFFRDTIHQLEESYGFMCIDWFDHLGYDCFYDLTHLNLQGTLLTSALIAMKLNMAKLIPTKNFLDMDYNYFYCLSLTAPKKEYNLMMNRIFEASTERLRQKDKIKIAFFTRRAEEWCGDEVYNLFANDERFEATIFICFEFAIEERRDNKAFRENFWHGVEQFKERGLNVIAVDNEESMKACLEEFTSQDIVFYLSPYRKPFPEEFHYDKFSAKTLLTHTPYGIGIAMRREKYYYKSAFFHIVWKMFFTSQVELEIYDKEVQKGMPRGLYSGYPRMDIFFDGKASFDFKWKKSRHNAKKIIWAPHWSINGGINQATFQWNYQFMYEFAKNHPKTSWVVKPHPALFYSVVQEGLFESEEAFKEYLQAWDALPNAMVYTGAYYQDIFATSDGMIHDCGSFIAEYQYTRKPMIFLTRAGEEFNELGNEILKASYLVDGKDLAGIAAILQRIFIKGDDYKSSERKKIFDKYLNYKKANGMTASEFIYKSIAEDLQKSEQALEE